MPVDAHGEVQAVDTGGEPGRRQVEDGVVPLQFPEHAADEGSEGIGGELCHGGIVANGPPFGEPEDRRAARGAAGRRAGPC